MSKNTENEIITIKSDEFPESLNIRVSDIIEFFETSSDSECWIKIFSRTDNIEFCIKVSKEEYSRVQNFFCQKKINARKEKILKYSESLIKNE